MFISLCIHTLVCMYTCTYYLFIGLFCRISSLLQGSFAKETCNFTYVGMHVNMYVRMYAYMNNNVCMHLYPYVYPRVSMYEFECVYILTHTYQKTPNTLPNWTANQPDLQFFWTRQKCSLFLLQTSHKPVRSIIFKLQTSQTWRFYWPINEVVSPFAVGTVPLHRLRSTCVR